MKAHTVLHFPSYPGDLTTCLGGKGDLTVTLSLALHGERVCSAYRDSAVASNRPTEALASVISLAFVVYST